MGVGCKLVHFVVYCVLFVVISTNTEKNSAVSEEGHVLTAYGFYLVVSLASKNSVKKRDQTEKKKKKRYKETEKMQRRQEWNPVYLHVQATAWPLHHTDTHDLTN